MFDKDRAPTTARIEITRVRNGFELTAPVDHCRNPGGLYETPYVFETLENLYHFLIENDWECTDE